MQPVLAKGKVIGRASFTHIIQAASRLVQSCVVERGMGGIGYDIGKHTLVISSVSLLQIIDDWLGRW